MYPEKTIIQKDTCTPCSLQHYLPQPGHGRQFRCPFSDEWIKKLWYIDTMEYYSAIKRNGVESLLVRWTNPEPIMQSEVCQREKNKYPILTHIDGI